MTKDNGGPAFSAAWGNPQQGGDYVPGMSLRDWFAGQALAGIGNWVPGHSNFRSAEGDAANRASWAYAQADAMLAARKDTRDAD